MIIQDSGKSKRIGKSGLDNPEHPPYLLSAAFRERTPAKNYSLWAFMACSRLYGVLSGACSCRAAS